MAEHDFRYTLLNPQHSLNECRTLTPGHYQLSGCGGSIQPNDSVLISLKGSRDLYMRLTLNKVRHLMQPPGSWIATATGPVFGELVVRQELVRCKSCDAELEFEFAYDAKQKGSQEQAIQQRLTELGWPERSCSQCRGDAS